MDVSTLHDGIKTVVDVRRAAPEVFEITKQIIGTYITDPLKFARQQKNLERVARITQKKIDVNIDIDSVESTTEILPLLEAIQDDDRKELQEIWANMLAKFLTGESSDFRREYIDTLKKLEPIDVKCLEVLVIEFYNESYQKNDFAGKISIKTGKNIDNIEISLSNLERVGCFERTLNMQNNPTTYYRVSAYGRMLFKAASPRPEIL